MNSIEVNLPQLLLRICHAAVQAGSSPEKVTIVAVTKTLPSQAVRKAYALGLRHFGENKVQEAIEKYEVELGREPLTELRLHLIGHLQSNKVRKAVQSCYSIDTVDSLELGKAISQSAVSMGKTVRVLIEVNSSGEPQKFGVSAIQAFALAEGLSALPNLELAGLMTIGPLTDDVSMIRSAFAATRAEFERIRSRLRLPSWSVLSMGMSGDFELAIAEGATEIRLGTALFGPRLHT